MADLYYPYEDIGAVHRHEVLSQVTKGLTAHRTNIAKEMLSGGRPLKLRKLDSLIAILCLFGILLCENTVPIMKGGSLLFWSVIGLALMSASFYALYKGTENWEIIHQEELKKKYPEVWTKVRDALMR